MTIDQIATQLRAELEAYGAEVREQLELEEAAHDATLRQLHELERGSVKANLMIADIKSLLIQAERGRISDYEAMAKIRGILHYR